MLRDRFFSRGKLAHRKNNESLEPCGRERRLPGLSPQTAVPTASRAGPERAHGNPSAERPGGAGAQAAAGLPGAVFPSQPSRSCSELGHVPCGCWRRRAGSPPRRRPESHRAALLCPRLIWTLSFAYREHPRREAATAEPRAPAHPELPYMSLPSRGTRPFLSLLSLRLHALLLPAAEKPCQPITPSNRLSPPLAREQLPERSFSASSKRGGFCQASCDVWLSLRSICVSPWPFQIPQPFPGSPMTPSREGLSPQG